MQRILAVFLVVALAALARAAEPPVITNEVRALVQRGLASLKAGELEAARTALESANETAVDNPTIAYDLGCVLLAAGSLADAEEAFAAAASRHETALALDLARNRALVAARQAAEVGGAEPEKLQGKDREKLVEHVGRAVSHLRTILDAEPADQNARRDMGVLKAWLISLVDAWRLADEERAKEPPPPEQPPSSIELLGKLRVTEKSIAKAVPPDADDSSAPVLTALAGRQREEAAPKIPEIQEAFAREFEQVAAQHAAAPAPTTQPGGGQPPQPPAGGGEADEQLQQAKESVEKALESIGGLVETSAAEFEAGRADSGKAAAENAEQLADQLWRALAPFPAVLGRAHEEQKAILEAGDQGLSADQAAARTLTELMVEKADEMLASMPPEDPQAPPAGSGTPAPPADGGIPRQALTTAKELGPQAALHQQNAIGLMDLAKWPGALDEQKAALDLLERILDELPQDQQQQSGKPGESEEQEQEQEQEQQEEQDAQGQQDDQEQQEQEEQKQGEEVKPGELSPEQIQALLQQIREREAKRRDDLQRLRGLGRAPVDKDW